MIFNAIRNIQNAYHFLRYMQKKAEFLYVDNSKFLKRDPTIFT